MRENCIHFVASEKPAGAPLGFNRYNSVCEERSAGHPRHEYTTGYAHGEIFKHFGYVNI